MGGLYPSQAYTGSQNPVTVTVICASCTALAHTDSDSDSYMCLLHRAGAHWIPRMGGLYLPQAKVEMGSIGVDSRSNIHIIQ